MENSIEKTKYLIIGNSAGGIGAAESIREADKSGAITIVSDEPYPAYSRPLISEYLAERRSVESMLYRPPDFYEKNNIKAVLGKKAKRLDVGGHVVELADGTKIAWEKLLLATGGLPIVPRTEGISRRGVFTFTTLDDAKAIDEFLSWSGQAVVIGGGLIGVSVAEALVKRGIEVSIVEMKEHILNTILDSEASTLVEEAIGRNINIVTGRTVAGISGYPSKDDAVSGVTLDDGSWLNCNLLVVAIGVRPRMELAADAGLAINRGIVVDRRMTTSHPDIYACGDACEAYDFIYDDNRLTPIWPNAYMGGRVAGQNMAGVSAEYKRATVLNSLKYFGLDIATAGMVAPPSENGYEVLKSRHDSIYRMTVLKDGLLVGMVFVGSIEKAGIVFSLMKEKINVVDFKEALISPDFSLTSLPERIWRERLAVPA